jgi:hypothetical protein
LPRLDQEKGCGTRRVYGEPGYAGVDSPIASLTPVRVACVGSERANAVHDRIQATENSTHIACDFVRNTLLVGREPERFADGLVETLNVLLLRQRS